MNKFWNFKNEGEQRELRLDGAISEETWFDDEVSPKLFRDELNAGKGRLKLWINSPGGDVFAASQIYTMLKEYKDGVDVYIDALAASAASVIAMSGEKVFISPTAIMMIHNPATFAWGDREEFKGVIKVLDEIKETIVNAYEIKTKLPREEISKMMTAETWFSAKKAVELGFADEILYSAKTDEDTSTAVAYSQMTVTNSLLDKIKTRLSKQTPKVETPKVDNRVDSQQLHKRLNLLARKG